MTSHTPTSPRRTSRRTHITWIGALVCAAFIAMPAASEAVPLTFNCVSQGAVTYPSCGEYESAYSVEISAVGADDVFFQFFNNGLAGYNTGSIDAVYFDVPSVNPFSGNDTNYTIDNGSGVWFVKDSTPNDNINGFDSAYKAQSIDGGWLGLGVDAGESVGFRFDLRSAFDFDDVVSALSAGTLRMGLYVNGLDLIQLGHATFVSNPYSTPTNPTPVPEPASMLLLGSGLAGIAGYARRRRQARQQDLA